MDDVTRLFRKLVDVLAADDPARLRRPFRIAELHERILPYRHFKRHLQFDSAEDYEMAVLRFLAGEGGYASVDHEEIRETLAVEAEAVNPDTGAFRAFGDAEVMLNPRAVQAVINEEASYAPPVIPPPPSAFSRDPEAVGESAGAEGGPVFEALEVDGPEEPDEAETYCPECRAALPKGRTVAFCPFCGQLLEAGICQECGDPIDPGWRFCASCGRPVSG